MPRVRCRRRRCTVLPALLAALLATLNAAACSGDATKPAAPSLSGTYELIEVDGTALPFTIPISFGFYRRQIVSGTLEFREQTRVLDALSLQNVDGAGEPLAEPEADTVIQTYRLSGTELVVERSVSGGTVTHADTGVVHEGLLGLKVRDLGVRFPGLDLRFLYRKR